MGNGGIEDSNKDCSSLQATTFRTSGGVETKFKLSASQFVEQ